MGAKGWKEKGWREEWRVHCDLMGKGGDRSPDLPLSRWTPCPPGPPHGGSLASSAHWRKARGREGKGVEGEGVEGEGVEGAP